MTWEDLGICWFYWGNDDAYVATLLSGFIFQSSVSLSKWKQWNSLIIQNSKHLEWRKNVIFCFFFSAIKLLPVFRLVDCKVNIFRCKLWLLPCWLNSYPQVFRCSFFAQVLNLTARTWSCSEFNNTKQWLHRINWQCVIASGKRSMTQKVLLHP